MNEPIELAGERLTVRQEGNGTTISFDDKGTGRQCGACQLCCKLLPIKVVHKPAGVRCRYQQVGKGCRIYASRPMECRTWACRWLADPTTAGMPRPDRAHYVIDIEGDRITLQNGDDPPFDVGAFQVWCDPAFPDAYRAPELMAWMARMAKEHRAATIVRFNSADAVLVFPPEISADGTWHFVTGAPKRYASAAPRPRDYAVTLADGSVIHGPA